MEGKRIKKLVSFLIFVFIFGLCFSAQAGQVAPPVINYAPNLWFDSEEIYYPVNILDFYFENGIEIEGEKAVEKYNQLSIEDKVNNLTVFYNIEDEGNQWVYQYWFFYVYNDYKRTTKNEHYGDWESVFVFVDKDSKEVVKTVGTSHIRKLFDTEIYQPETNHIWSYISEGSHAICVVPEDNNRCDSFKWRIWENWDKKGVKVEHNKYQLTEITFDFISLFNNSDTLNKSPDKGVSFMGYGGKPPIYAWEQESFKNSEVIVPISRKLIAEYVFDKVDQTKAMIVGFFGNLFKTEQQANISSIPEVIPVEEVIVIEEPVVEIKQEIKQEKIIEPVVEIKKQIIIETVIETVIEEVVEEQEIEIEIVVEPEIVIPSPIAPPVFIGSGGAYVSPEPEPEIVDIIPPSDINDLSAEMGNNRGEINLSWTSPGASEYIIKYSTSSAITDLIWASSTDIITEPIPNIASSTESLTIDNLNVNQIYYWAIKSQDAVGNLSGISNSASSSPYALANSLVISEVQVKGSSANDEFIELYNPTSSAIDISEWSIQYRGGGATSFQKKNFVTNNSIPANGFFLIANSSYDGHMIADMSHSSFSMSGTGGTVFLVNNDIELTDSDNNSIIDKISYGSGTYLFPETSKFDLVPDDNQSLERKNQINSTAELLAVSGDEHWKGNNWDSNNNSNDFVLQATTSPQNSLSLIEPRNSFASLADTAWPMLQNDISHTGLSSYGNNATGTPTSTPKWIASLGVIGPNEPVIGLDGSIYVGTGDGKLHKITTAGATSTFYNIGINGNVEAPVISSDGTIYITDNKDLYALTADGQVIWEYPIYNTSAPVITSDGTIYVASDYYLYALTPNGEKIWQSPQLSNGRWVRSPIIDSNGNIYTVGRACGNVNNCNVVYALNSLDGSIIWDTSANLKSYYTALSLDDSDTLYVGAFSGSPGLYAINTSNGSQKWHATIGNILESTPAINQDTIYVGSYTDGMVYSIDRINGNVNWSYYIGGNISAAPIIDNQGVIYIGSTNNMFYAINSDGTLKWLAELSDEIQHNAIIDSNGVVYVFTKDGNIYAFGE